MIGTQLMWGSEHAFSSVKVRPLYQAHGSERASLTHSRSFLHQDARYEQKELTGFAQQEGKCALKEISHLSQVGQANGIGKSLDQ